MELQMISPQTASRSHPLLPQICMPWLNAFRMTRQCRSGYLPMPNNYEKKKTAHPQHNTDNRRSSHIQIFIFYSPAHSNSCPIFETNRSNATSFFPLLITISARALVGSTYM